MGGEGRGGGLCIEEKEVEEEEEEGREGRGGLGIKKEIIEMGNGSQVIYVEKLIESEKGWEFFQYLNDRIPWTRPTIRVFGRSCLQPRDTCYVATPGLPQYIYSSYKPHAYSWDHFPPLKLILEAVESALPGTRFNTLLLNRYIGGNDYVGWHSDDETLYGPTPDIASLSFGCHRHFYLKKKKKKKNKPHMSSKERRGCDEDPSSCKRKRLSKKSSDSDVEQHYSFLLKHGSLLLMRGYTQRDWFHSVPKRSKVEATRINLTFRRIL